MAVSVEEGYRSAFEDFSRRAQKVQFLTEHPNGDREAFETALLDLEKAHLAYNDARDALVRSLLPASVPAPPRHRQDHLHDVPDHRGTAVGKRWTANRHRGRRLASR